MARFDGKLTAAGEASLDAAELLAALRSRSGGSDLDRAHAIACYLSAGDGWREAVEKLGGAFAPSGEEAAERDDTAPKVKRGSE